MRKLLTAFLAILLFCTAADATTLLQARTKLRTWLYDTDSANYLYSDVTLNDSLYRACSSLVDMTPKSANPRLIKKTVTTLSAGTNTVSITTMPRTLFSVTYNDEPAIQMKLEEYTSARKQATFNDPHFCFRMDTAGVQLILEVFPYATATQNMIEYIGLYSPAQFATDASVLETDARFDDLVLNLAAYDVLMTDNQPIRAANFEKKISNYIQIMNNQWNNQGVVEPPIATGGK